MKIVRVLNNNVVLATRDNGGEVVLTGWGLGFGKKAGQPVDKSKVKQVFVPEHGRNVDNMGSLLASLNLDYVDLATHLVDRTAGSLIPHPESATIIALADHIQMSVTRQGLADAHATDDHPLEAEVRHLYPDEYRVAEQMLTEINAWLAHRHQPPLPHAEATAITLHLVNAAFHTDDLSDTYTMTGLFSQKECQYFATALDSHTPTRCCARTGWPASWNCGWTQSLPTMNERTSPSTSLGSVRRLTRLTPEFPVTEWRCRARPRARLAPTSAKTRLQAASTQNMSTHYDEVRSHDN